jgi:hypothetical protein
MAKTALEEPIRLLSTSSRQRELAAEGAPRRPLNPMLQLQQTIGNRAVGQLIRRAEESRLLHRQSAGAGGVVDPWTSMKRQFMGGNYTGPATSGPTSSLPAPEPNNPAYTETPHASSYRIRVVGHASPRWRGAADAKEADKLNLDLSRRRARNVGLEVQKRLSKLLPQGASTSVDASAEMDDNTVAISEEAHGSRDTLKEAQGKRSDNDKTRRRVDVYISSSQDVEGEAGASKKLEMAKTASQFWHISVNASGGGGEDATATFMAAVLTNDKTGESMNAHVWGIGKGFSGPFPASASISFSDATGFSTREPMDFKDFNSSPVFYDNASLSFFAGYARSYITFLVPRTEPRDINVSGTTAGTPGFDISSGLGVFRFDSDTFPPTEVPIKGSDETKQAYRRTDKQEAHWALSFETDADHLDEKHEAAEVALLDSFLTSFVASQK